MSGLVGEGGSDGRIRGDGKKTRGSCERLTEGEGERIEEEGDDSRSEADEEAYEGDGG